MCYAHIQQLGEGRRIPTESFIHGLLPATAAALPHEHAQQGLCDCPHIWGHMPLALLSSRPLPDHAVSVLAVVSQNLQVEHDNISSCSPPKESHGSGMLESSAGLLPHLMRLGRVLAQVPCLSSCGAGPQG